MQSMKRRRPPFMGRKKRDRNAPMLELLSQAFYRTPDGTNTISIAHGNQWRTLWKAQRIGLVTDDEDDRGCHRITGKGREWYAAHGGSENE